MEHTGPMIVSLLCIPILGERFGLFKISAVLSPTGKESMIPLQIYKCDKCGHINKEFLPKA